MTNPTQTPCKTNILQNLLHFSWLKKDENAYQASKFQFTKLNKETKN
jgi:hypothetical protein